ncbi:MAG: hypothetical protein KKE17_15150 [Proteobacteria bacterium]|nr:hypothetical protein [Pseudomonadota bacterium]MBU1711336.1 hypothetical protein [Pseudomonadota bacterium]
MTQRVFTVALTVLFLFIGELSSADPPDFSQQLSPLYSSLFEKNQTFNFEVLATTSRYVNDAGENEYSERKEVFKVECTVKEALSYPSYQASWVECLGAENLLANFYVGTAQGLWVANAFPEDKAFAEEIIQSPPLLAANPAPSSKPVTPGCKSWITSSKIALYGGIKEKAWCNHSACPGAGSDESSIMTCFLPEQGPVFIENFQPSGTEDYTFLALAPPTPPINMVNVAQDTLDHGVLNRVQNLFSKWANAQSQNDFPQFSRCYDQNFTGIEAIQGKNKEYDRKDWLYYRKKLFATNQHVVVKDLKITSIMNTRIDLTLTKIRRSFQSSSAEVIEFILKTNNDNPIIVQETIRSSERQEEKQ